MAAIGLSGKDAKKVCPPDVISACHNGPASVTISGPVKTIQAFVKELKSKNIFAKQIKSSGLAFHSKYIMTAAPILRALLDEIIPTEIIPTETEVGQMDL